MDTNVAVRGHATIEVAPDYAAVRVTVTKVDQAADAAVDDVAQRTRVLDGLFDALGDVVTNRVATSLSVGPEFTYDRRTGERSERGHRATRAVQLEVRDPSVLGRLLRDAVGQVGAAVDGPWWRVDDTNPGHSEARRQAAADARARAEDYAAGLGISLGSVVWVAEPGLRKPDGGGPLGAARAETMMAAPAGAPTDEQPPALIDVVAEKVTLHATVEVGFALLP
jgi:uncharacterized protein YggE